MDTENWGTVFVEPRKEWHQKPRRKNLPPAVGFWIGRIALLSAAVSAAVVVLFALPKGSTSPERHSNGTKYSNPRDVAIARSYQAIAARYREIACNPSKFDLKKEHLSIGAAWKVESNRDDAWLECDKAVMYGQVNLAMMRDSGDVDMLIIYMRGLHESADKINEATR